MKDFDIIRAEAREGGDRTFKIGGEELTFRPYLYPDVVVRAQSALDDAELLATLDDVFLNDLLEPGQDDKWFRVRARENPAPPDLRDLVAVLNYVTEVTSGRPTEPSSDSSGAQSKNGTESKVRSRGKQAATSPS